LYRSVTIKQRCRSGGCAAVDLGRIIAHVLNGLPNGIAQVRRPFGLRSGFSGVHLVTDPEAASGWVGTVNGMPDVGSFAERSRQVTMRDVEAFSEMTGDRNPLHYDRELAEKSVFGKLIVQGGVTSGILNAIVAEDLPGPGTVFLGVEWKFSKAVGVGERITGRVEVTKVRADKPIVTLITTITNADGEVCLSGTATTYTVPLRKATPKSAE
jgi:acyl dehydratase